MGILGPEMSPMSKTSFPSRLRLAAGIALLPVALALFAQASPKESLRAELIRLQKQNGLSLVCFEGSAGNGHVSVVVFATRSLTERDDLKEESAGENAAQNRSPESMMMRKVCECTTNMK
jgi:hypothetical protein